MLANVSQDPVLVIITPQGVTAGPAVVAAQGQGYAGAALVGLAVVSSPAATSPTYS